MRPHLKYVPHANWRLPPDREPPEYPRIALVVRMWGGWGYDYEPIDAATHLAVWCLRAWMLNTDASDHAVTPVFYVESGIADIVFPTLDTAGVPDANRQLWDQSEVVPGATHWGLNAAPLVDTRLHDYDHLIIVDEDFFPVRPFRCNNTLPIFETILRDYPEDMHTCGRGWDRHSQSGAIEKYAAIHGLALEQGTKQWLDKAVYWTKGERDHGPVDIDSEGRERHQAAHGRLFYSSAFEMVSKQYGIPRIPARMFTGISKRRSGVRHVGTPTLLRNRRDIASRRTGIV